MFKKVSSKATQIWRSGFLFTFWALGAVFGTALVALLNAGSIQRTANNGVTYTGQVFYTTTAHKHNGVLLQVVSLSRNVGNDLDAIDQTHLGHFPQGGIRLLGRCGIDTGANPALLRTRIERTAFAFVLYLFAAVAYQLINGWHTVCD